jgi:hypothetical protein
MTILERIADVDHGAETEIEHVVGVYPASLGLAIESLVQECQEMGLHLSRRWI